MTDAPPPSRSHSAGSLLRGSIVALFLLGLLMPTGAAAAGPDSDGDGLRDAFEQRTAGLLDPGDRDTDGDGVVDPAEDSDGDRLGNFGEQRFGTRPGVRDSDGDGRSDGQEDADRDGRSNAREQDQRPVPKGLRPSLTQAPEDIWARQPACGAHWGVVVARRCWFGSSEGAISVAVVGDSKATMYMPAFIAAAKQRGWRVVSFLKGTCSPVLGTTNGQQYLYDRGRTCDRWRHNVIDWLVASAPELIVYAHSDDYGLVDDRGGVIPGPRKPEVWRQGVARTVAALPVSSAVVWLGDAPNIEGNPVRCLKDHGRDMSACVTPREAPSARPVEKALRQGAADAGGQFRTLQDQVCTYDPCPVVQGDVLMWRDGGHLTVTFTRLLAPSMGQLLADALAGAP